MQGIDTLWLPWLNYGINSSQVNDYAAALGLAIDWNRVEINRMEKIRAISLKVFTLLYNSGYIYRKSSSNGKWYLKISKISGRAIKAVEKGEVIFTPEKWAHLFLDWLKRTGDLCISCQPNQELKIPSYQCTLCQHPMIEETAPGKCSKCDSNKLKKEFLGLNTWFTAALSPLAALGWHYGSQDFNIFYPSSLMITDTGTFFLKVARMILLGLVLTRRVPFREVLVRGIIRKHHATKKDNHEKNVGNPLDITAKYGADAFRFSMAVQAGSNSNISIHNSRLKGSMRFTNKIWNAARYITHVTKNDESFKIDCNLLTDPDKWILHSLNTTIVKVNDLMDNYHINLTAKIIYRFIRRQFCDWYLECVKNDIDNSGSRNTLKFTLFTLLRLLHPFMPFITEAVYQKIKGQNRLFLLQTGYPAFQSELVFSNEFSSIEMLKKIVMEIRKIRTENKIHPNKPIPVYLKTGSKKESEQLTKNMKYFNNLTQSVKTEIVCDFSDLPKGFKGSYLNWEILLPLNKDEDKITELNRLNKERENLEIRIKDMEKKLSDNRFLKKTPHPTIRGLKKKLQEVIGKRNKIQKTIDDLS